MSKAIELHGSRKSNCPGVSQIENCEKSVKILFLHEIYSFLIPLIEVLLTLINIDRPFTFTNDEFEMSSLTILLVLSRNNVSFGDILWKTTF